MSQEEFPGTRATAVGSYNGIQALTLAFYKDDGTEQCKATHTKGSMPEGDTFGEFSTSLPLGSYTMVVLGNAGAAQVIEQKNVTTQDMIDRAVRQLK